MRQQCKENRNRLPTPLSNLKQLCSKWNALGVSIKYGTMGFYILMLNYKGIELFKRIRSVRSLGRGSMSLRIGMEGSKFHARPSSICLLIRM